MWFLKKIRPIQAPAGSPLKKGMTVRVVESMGCQATVRGKIVEGVITEFVKATELWPDSNFELDGPCSIFAKIESHANPRDAFISSLKGDKPLIDYRPADRHYWWQNTDDDIYEYHY